MTNFIVLHYKLADMTRKCVDSIFDVVDNAKVYIVDNASRNGSLEYLRDIYSSQPKVVFVEMFQNVGFARANNAAMRLLREQGEHYAVLTNNDIVFTKWGGGNT